MEIVITLAVGVALGYFVVPRVVKAVKAKIDKVIGGAAKL